MKIALVDDERPELDRLSEMISRQLCLFGDMTYKIDTYTSGEEFLQHWQAGRYDLVVLDIFMDKLLGVDVAHKIRETDRDVRLVFCTTSNEYASESYEVGAHYYLHKPITESTVKRMMDRLEMELLEKLRAVTLPDGQKVVLRSILYTEYIGRSAFLHLKRGIPLECRTTQGALEELLCSHSQFFCCSKGMIFNFHEVAQLREDSFLLYDDSVVPISRRKAKAVQEAYAHFRFEEMRREVQK